MFKKKPICRDFISSIDKAVAEFNRSHPLSRAQQEEADKYARIYDLRDHKVQSPSATKNLWDLKD